MQRWKYPLGLALILAPVTAVAAPFQNLDFEQADIEPAFQTPVVPFDANNPIDSSEALPGWTVTEDGVVCNAIWSGPGLDETSVSLVTSGPLQGKYTLLMSSFNPSNNIAPFFRSSMISQTGDVPANAKSVQFEVGVPAISGGETLSVPIVTVNGQALPLVTLSTSGNTSLMACDVSAFAGKTVDLGFEALGNSEPLSSVPPDFEDYFELDDIQFSPQSVPEPASIALVACSFAVVLRRRQRLAAPIGKRDTQSA